MNLFLSVFVYAEEINYNLDTHPQALYLPAFNVASIRGWGTEDLGTRRMKIRNFQKIMKINIYGLISSTHLIMMGESLLSLSRVLVCASRTGRK